MGAMRTSPLLAAAAALAAVLSGAVISGAGAPAAFARSAQATNETATGCTTKLATIDKSFPTGAFARCDTASKSRFTLTIAPEDDGDINCSPWYAFRVTAARKTRIAVKLDYATCGHRYWPKTSTDGVTWTKMPANRVVISGDGDAKTALLTLELDQTPLFIAAQEIFPPAAYDAWLAQLQTHDFVRRDLLGKSAEGRDIDRLRIAAPGAQPRETVVLVGRQHPPEVSGALAMVAFVDTLAEDSELAKTYRQRFETLIVPLVNPDGVVRGHWRHNTGGIDLNRDWGPFTQPETRLMQGLFDQIRDDPDRQLAVMIDFHSTNRDVFYTIPDELPTKPELFTRKWLDLFQQRMPGYEVERDARHDVGRPISKAYTYDTFGAPGVTFELGDDTDRALIKTIGREAAIAMMQTLLESAGPNPAANSD